MSICRRAHIAASLVVLTAGCSVLQAVQLSVHASHKRTAQTTESLALSSDARQCTPSATAFCHREQITGPCQNLQTCLFRSAAQEKALFSMNSSAVFSGPGCRPGLSGHDKGWHWPRRALALLWHCSGRLWQCSGELAFSPSVVCYQPCGVQARRSVGMAGRRASFCMY